MARRGEVLLRKPSARGEGSVSDYRANQRIASDEAKAEASGVTSDSFMPVLSESAAEQRINDLYRRYSGRLAATQDLYEHASREDRQRGRSGLFGVAKDLLRKLGTDVGNYLMRKIHGGARTRKGG